MRRIDWHHVAKTGEFVTVQYREEQAIRTVLILDARRVGRVTAQPGYPTGAELAGYAGERLYDALTNANVVTGVTAVGLEAGTLDGLVGPDGLPWIDPEQHGGGTVGPNVLFDGLQQVAQQNAAKLSTQPPSVTDTTGGARAATPRTDGGRSGRIRREPSTIDRILTRLDPNAQVVVCSPLLDDWPVELAQALAVRGYPQVVVSPDVTGGETMGQRVAGVHRRLRLDAVERAGAEVVSWDAEQPIDYALRRSLPQLLTQR
jgi:hypothetical protein